MSRSGYDALGAACQAETQEKGSRFLAILRPASDEEGARQVLADSRRAHPEATHHCFAWRIGNPPIERAADDGEPAGTAGQPMLRTLRGADLSDVVAVVVRWYGGTKLGKGGLARAYAGAVTEALSAARRTRRVTRERFVIALPFDRLGAVKRLVRPPDIVLLEERYDDGPRLTLSVAEDAAEALTEALAELGLTAQTNIS